MKAEKHIPDYEKKKKFLQNAKWVEDLCAENKYAEAIRRAAEFGMEGGSYSNIYKAFELFEKLKYSSFASQQNNHNRLRT